MTHPFGQSSCAINGQVPFNTSRGVWSSGSRGGGGCVGSILVLLLLHQCVIREYVPTVRARVNEVNEILWFLAADHVVRIAQRGVDTDTLLSVPRGEQRHGGCDLRDDCFQVNRAVVGMVVVGGRGAEVTMGGVYRAKITMGWGQRVEISMVGEVSVVGGNRDTSRRVVDMSVFVVVLDNLLLWVWVRVWR